MFRYSEFISRAMSLLYIVSHAYSVSIFMYHLRLGISSDILMRTRDRPGTQKWIDCLTNDIRSWPFLPRQISCLEPVSARDMQIALIYTGSGDCCLVRLATTSQIGVVWVRRTCLSIDCHAWHHTSRILSFKSSICNKSKNNRIVEYK